MKITTILVSLCLVSVSLMGQKNYKNSENDPNHFKAIRNLTNSKFQSGVEKFYKGDFTKTLSKQTDYFLKSTSIIKQTLDSVVIDVYDAVSEKFMIYYKEEFKYNSEGYLTSELYFNWNESTKKWIGDSKYEYTYNSNGNLTLEVEYSLDEKTSAWVEISKNESTYDSNGNCTLKIQSDWDQTSSKWIKANKREYGFDSNGNSILSIIYGWDETTIEWILDIKIENQYDSNGNLAVHIDYNSTGDKVKRKEEYTYDPGGNLSSDITYVWDEISGIWVLGWQREYTHDANGNLTLEIDSRWDHTNLMWIESYKDEFINDSNGNSTSDSSYMWDELNSNWILIGRSESTYDTNGNPTSCISFSWDEATSLWTGNSKWEDGYDSNGNLIFASEFEWDETTSNWIGYYKDEYIYDITILANELILPGFYFDDEFINKVTDILYYSIDENSGQWYVDSRVKFFYSDNTNTGIEGNKQNGIKVYPNPAADILNFDITNSYGSATIEICNIQGKLLLQKEVSQNLQISVDHLPRGLYIYKINDSNAVKTGKIILQ